MTTTNPVSFDYSTVNKKTTVTKSAMEEQQDRFLKLFVKQLQSQDPMNPMDNAQTTTQMAQINTVTGIEKLNQTMQNMQAAFSASQSIQAASLIGKDVLAPGKTVAFSGSTIGMKLQLPAAAEKVAFLIADKNGAIVDQMVLGPQAAGQLPIEWDGKLANGSTAPNGEYQVYARAVVDGREIATEVLTWQKAGSVSIGSDGVKVNLASGSQIDFSAITQIK
jgi:flagellar basal-body rod modification protein FlgD